MKPELSELIICWTCNRDLEDNQEISVILLSIDAPVVNYITDSFSNAKRYVEKTLLASRGDNPNTPPVLKILADARNVGVEPNA